MSAIPGIAGGVAALGVARWWYPGTVERASAARLPVGADGIIAGAGAIALDGRRDGRGALILHGFGDTPQSVEFLARALTARGYTVYAPLLAGHGRTLREFARSGGAGWLDSARASFLALRDRCARVYLVGQSLGGALAAVLAAEQPDARALALLAPYFNAQPYVRAFARVAPLVELLAPYLTTSDERSIHDPAARAASLSFGATTPRLTRELLGVADRARAVLPRLTLPVIYLQSREDNRIAAGVAERAFAALGTAEKEMVWLEDCGHVIAADRSRARVAERVGGWFDAR